MMQEGHLRSGVFINSVGLEGVKSRNFMPHSPLNPHYPASDGNLYTKGVKVAKKTNYNTLSDSATPYNKGYRRK